MVGTFCRQHNNNPVLLPPGRIAVFSVVLALYAADSVGQTQKAAATLWQFGELLDSGETRTLPLVPLTTATDGSATAYLYQVVNDADKTISRTIFASASGWIERFGSDSGFECGFIDTNFGICSFFASITTSPRATNAYSGPPIPDVIQIEQPSSTALPRSFSSTHTASSSSPPRPLPPNSKHSVPVGSVVGGVSAVLAGIVGGLVAFIVLRRRRERQMWEMARIAPRAYSTSARNPPATIPVFVSNPQPEMRSGPGQFGANNHAREVASASPTATFGGVSHGRSGTAVPFQMVSELPMSDLVQLLAQRLQTEEPAPPYALVEMGDA
ncbi:hypothetical protein B0H16DRAFT_1689262 [Mycena metata]|uniref:Transmembrane protein n=1 Tax=Mycena metata TaxID=1033252 RepID=A0AAD7NGC3_9AGAR|nr:hypothetical protein B0H16DRAFT_1689262 [Mycena metata]